MNCSVRRLIGWVGLVVSSTMVNNVAAESVGAERVMAENVMAESAAASSAVAGVALPETETPPTDLPDGRQLIEQVNAVPECPELTRTLNMRLIDKRGKVRERSTLNYRKQYDDHRRSLIVYTAPRNIKNTAFLTHDFTDASTEDHQWLYLPALRKTRRIAAANRGDYFLGTDLTYEDTKKEGKVEIGDYQYQTLSSDSVEGVDYWLVEAIPVTEALGKALGYGKAHAWVEQDRAIIRQVKYWDTKLNLLKTVKFEGIQQIDGYWMRERIEVDHHKTGHRTEFLFGSMDCSAKIEDRWLTRPALSRGLPQ